MKTILFVLLVLCSTFGKATNIYFANSGSDAASGTLSSPYQTIAKLNSLTLAAGDNVYFKRGDTFYGSIIISKSGIIGNRIVFGAYGTGAKPIITGFQ